MSTTRYNVSFGSAVVDTTVTSDAAAADEWVRRVRASATRRGGYLLVGLDCDWKPCDHIPGATPKVAILQLCAGTSCLILQLLYVGRVPPLVRDLLADRSVRFVGIGVGEDVAKLADGYGLPCAWPVDLEDVCNRHLGLPGWTRLGLKGYVENLLALTMKKPTHVTRSDWEKRELDVEQVQYTCLDAYVSYKLGERVIPK